MTDIKIKPKTTIQKALVETIENIMVEMFKDDKSCKPQYVLSRMRQEQSREDVVLTIIHMGTAHSEIIGMDTDLEDVIDTLYNRTM